MKIFRFVVTVLLCAAIVVGIVLAAINMPKRPCSGYDFKVQYAGEYPALCDSDICQMIAQNNVHTIGVPMKDVELEKIADLLSQNPYVESVDEVRFSSTKLKIQVTLKNILLHVYAQDGSQYFVDENGNLLPFSMNVRENVMVANGNIPEKFAKGKNIASGKGNLTKAYKIATCINDDEFYRTQFRQLYIDAHNEVVLVPTVGRHIVMFGSEANAQEKLFNLQQTYQKGLAYMGMDAYSSLDLRYKNRVIAKKRHL